MMTLTRPRYGQHLQPLLHRELSENVEQQKPTDLLQKYKDLTLKKKTLPSITVKPTHQIHTCNYCARKIIENHDYDYIYKNSKPQDSKTAKNKRPIRSYSSADETAFPLNKASSITARKRSVSTDFLQYMDSRSKHVSFSLPTPLVNPKKTFNVSNERPKNNTSMSSHICTHENINLNKLKNLEIKTRVISHEHNKPNHTTVKQLNETIKNISKKGNLKLAPLALKVKQRRQRKNLNERKPKVIVYEEPPVLERARQALVFKMKNPRQSEFHRRRVIHLPALAAPCSEEFVITMRRLQQGHRFISSPAVFNHVTKMSVPVGASEALLDAMLRPPSGLSPLKLSGR